MLVPTHLPEPRLQNAVLYHASGDGALLSYLHHHIGDDMSAHELLLARVELGGSLDGQVRQRQCAHHLVLRHLSGHGSDRVHHAHPAIVGLLCPSW